MPVGLAYTGSGASANPQGNRYSRDGGLVVSQGRGKYTEAAYRGQLFAAGGTTGRAPGTAISTAPALTIYNPAGSGVIASIMKVGVGQAPTGTLGTGVFYHCGFTINGNLASQAGVIPVVGSGAALTPRNLSIGGAASAMQVWDLGTLSVAPIQLYGMAGFGESVGGTTTTAFWIYEDVDGAITLPQGTGWCLYGVSAAGASPLVLASAVWLEELAAPA